jgi:Concanavalin A-like lectin/glucanases superfamily/Bacterial Ig-like domain (group 2)
MSEDPRRVAITRLAIEAPLRRLEFLLLLAPAFVACGDQLQPEEPLEPADHREISKASVTSDGHTLLLLPFDSVLTAADGEAPTQASGLTFESGITGSGVLVDGSDRLDYATGGNFGSTAGTIEFWIKPRWNGNDHSTHFFFTIGDALWVVKDGADNLRFFLGPEDSEAYQGYNLGAWVANEWHHLAVTWNVPGELKTYVDGVLRISHPTGPQDLLSSLPPAMSIGSQSGSLQANAVIDQLRISDVARSEQEIAQSAAAGPTILQLTVQPITAEPFETWRQTPTLIAITNAGTHEYPASVATWSSSNPAVATVNAAGVIRAVTAGSATITATLGGVQGQLDLRVKAPVLPPTFEQIPSYLATPAANNLFEIPVVILRYLPTADGVNLDVSVNPDFYELNPISLEAMRQRIDTFDIRVKFMLEEGSRFQGYRNPMALPSLGYRVVGYITVYEPTPPGKVKGVAAGLPVYQPDYHQILERFNGERYVNSLGVKEFWLWTGEFNATGPAYDPAIHKPENFRGLDESNMAGPLTGDISNSGRDPTDLPIYSKTYVMYDQNLRRSEREAVHNRGHQLEQILEYANVRQDGNSSLFWQKFVGPPQIDPAVGFRRCGWTHIPPNTSAEYDYQWNYNEVLSDIADWTPEGIGQKALVSAHTWGDHPYAWPLGTAPTQQGDRNEAHWYIYWMQSMPGRGNTIPFGRDRMTNWWSFTGDWDGSIRSGLGLHERALLACGTVDPSAALRTLTYQVEALVPARKLSRAEAHALGVKLDAVARLVDRHHPKAAANVLRAFANQVRALIRSRQLYEADGQPLIEAASCLSTRLER